MHLRKLNLEQLHKTTHVGKHWIKIYDPKEKKYNFKTKKHVITTGFVRVGIVVILLLLVHRYYPEKIELLISLFTPHHTKAISSHSLEKQSLSKKSIEIKDLSYNEPLIHKNITIAKNSNDVCQKNLDSKNFLAPYTNCEVDIEIPQKVMPLEQIPHLKDKQKDERSEQISTVFVPQESKDIMPAITNNGVMALLRQCEMHFKADRLTTGREGTAVDCYRQVLVQLPDNVQAKKGLNKIERRYRQWAERAIKQGKLKSARKYIKRARQINPNSLALLKLQRHLKQRVQYLKKMKKSQPKKRSSIQKPSSKPRSKLQKRSPRCIDIVSQESLGIVPLTKEQKAFKRKYCY